MLARPINGRRVSGSAPELFGGEPCALLERLEFCPGDLGVADAGTEAAVGAGHDVLAADELGVADETLRDELGVLYEVGAVADHAGDQHRALRQPHLLEDPPLVLVAWVRGLDRIAARAHLEDDVDDVPERNVALVRSVEAAPADVQPDLLAGDVAKRVIERVDPKLRIAPVLRDAHLRIHLPAVGQVGIVDLQEEAGVDDCPILDRKSTRLNSSHPSISYAVFCLKK